MAKPSHKGPVIGLDVGSDSFRLVEGQKSGEKIRIQNFAKRLLTQKDGFSEDAVLGKPYILASVAGGKKIKKLSIHSTIPCRNLCIRVITLPAMPYQELYQAIKSKIRKFISADIQQVEFSFSVMGEVQEKGVKKLEVVFAAIQKSALTSYLKGFDLVGVKPKMVIPSCFAAWNTIRELGVETDGQSLMLINMERHDTDLTVCSENQFVFTRNISMGSSDFSQIIENQTKFSFQKPDELKHLWETIQEGDDSQDSANNAILGVKKKLQSEADLFSKEVELTSHHNYQITHGGKIDKCLIFGEGSKIPGFIDYLRKKLEIPIEVFNIPESALVLPKERQTEFLNNVSVYAQSLGALTSSADTINLVQFDGPKAKKGHLPKKAVSSSKAFPVVISLLVVLIVSIFSLVKGFNIYYKYQIKAYERKQDNLEEVTMQLMQIKKKMDILDRDKKVYLSLQEEYPSYTSIIAEICKAIPSKNIVIDDLSISKSRRISDAKTVPPLDFNIKGRIVGDNVQSSEATEFVLALEQSGYFENISLTIQERLDTTGQNRSLGIGFILRGNIRAEKKK